ncbi:MAG: hypothetical protein J7L26_12550 [Candidatus Aminicenantes bacterium]|nr:hypothetical protein [Candidatus Aminicenantes bacterium]
MIRYDSKKKLFRRDFFNFGGTLDEISPKTQFPEGNFSEIVNWRVSKDGRSVEKRPGYQKFDAGYQPTDPIIQIHDYKDPNNLRKTLIITQKNIVIKKSVPSYAQKYTNNLTNSYFFALTIWQNKLVAVEGTGKTIYVKWTSDGDTWTTQGQITVADSISGYDLMDIAEFNNELFIAQYSAGNIIVKWDGQNATEMLDINNYQACKFERWDGKLWLITDTTPYQNNNRRVIYYYDGNSWSAITNYDGAGYLDYNLSSGIPKYQWARQATSFFVWNDNLYLLATRWNSTNSKWSWQIWKFKKSSYDQFNKVFDSESFNDDYGATGIFAIDGKVYVVGNKIDNGKFTCETKLYKADNSELTSFSAVNTFSDIGSVNDIIDFDERVYLNVHSFNPSTSTRTWKVYYFDKLNESFILEKSVSLGSSYVTGGLCVFGGFLYASKFQEIFKRIVQENQYTEVYNSTENIEDPPDKVDLEGRVFIAGNSFGLNYVLEGDELYPLGIEAPTQAPTLSEGGEGNLTGTYRYVVTFYRSGNYPCESSPSPISDPITVSGKKIVLNNIPVSSHPKVNCRRIYRTYADGAVYYWVADINDNTTTTFEDNYTDAELGDEVEWDNDPPPVGKYFEIWDNRLWIAGNSEYPNMLFFTKTGTAEQWDGSFLAIRRRESDVITQIKAFGDVLYVFKNKSMFKVEKVGTSSYQVNQMPQNIGCDAPWSVAVCDKLMLWKSEYGIEVFNGMECYRPIVSEIIKNTINQINNNFKNRIFGGHNFKDHEYWLMIPTGDNEYPNKVIVFDYINKRFTIYEFAKKLTTLNYSYVNESLVNLIGTSDGNIYIFDSGYTDDETPINAYFKTGWINVTAEGELWNVLRRLFVTYILPANKTLTLKIYRNFKQTPFATISLAGSSPTGSLTDLREEIMRRINLGVRAYYVMFEFSNNEDTGGKCRVIGMTAYFKRKAWKRTVKGD